jgi:hypothetical protein
MFSYYTMNSLNREEFLLVCTFLVANSIAIAAVSRNEMQNSSFTSIDPEDTEIAYHAVKSAGDSASELFRLWKVVSLRLVCTTFRKGVELFPALQKFRDNCCSGSGIFFDIHASGRQMGIVFNLMPARIETYLGLYRERVTDAEKLHDPPLDKCRALFMKMYALQLLACVTQALVSRQDFSINEFVKAIISSCGTGYATRARVVDLLNREKMCEGFVIRIIENTSFKIELGPGIVELCGFQFESDVIRKDGLGFLQFYRLIFEFMMDAQKLEQKFDRCDLAQLVDGDFRQFVQHFMWFAGSIFRDNFGLIDARWHFGFQPEICCEEIHIKPSTHLAPITVFLGILDSFCPKTIDITGTVFVHAAKYYGWHKRL